MIYAQHDHLIKTRVTTAAKGLQPVLPIVLYNGSANWTARQDIYELITPEPPAFLQVYQPRLHYYLIDESRFTDEELEAKGTPLTSRDRKASNNLAGRDGPWVWSEQGGSQKTPDDGERPANTMIERPTLRGLFMPVNLF